MVIDAGQGRRRSHHQLMDVCRLRDTPIMTFINKLDAKARAHRTSG